MTEKIHYCHRCGEPTDMKTHVCPTNDVWLDFQERYARTYNNPVTIRLINEARGLRKIIKRNDDLLEIFNNTRKIEVTSQLPVYEWSWIDGYAQMRADNQKAIEGRPLEDDDDLWDEPNPIDHIRELSEHMKDCKDPKNCSTCNEMMRRATNLGYKFEIGV